MKEACHLFGIEMPKIKDMYFSLNFGWYSIVLDDNVRTVCGGRRENPPLPSWKNLKKSNPPFITGESTY